MKMKTGLVILLTAMAFCLFAQAKNEKKQDDKKNKAGMTSTKFKEPRKTEQIRDEIDKKDEYEKNELEKRDQEDYRLLQASFKYLKDYKYALKLIELTRHSNADVRLLAVETLGDIGGPKENKYNTHIMKVLLDFLDVKSMSTKAQAKYERAAAAAIRKLTLKQYRQLVPAIRRVFYESPSFLVQEAGADALEKLKYPAVKIAFRDIFERIVRSDEKKTFYNYKIRMRYLQSMFANGDHTSVPLLITFSQKYDYANSDFYKDDKSLHVTQAKNLFDLTRKAIEKHMTVHQYNDMIKVETITGINWILEQYKTYKPKEDEQGIKRTFVHGILTVLRKPNLGSQEYIRDLVLAKVKAVKLLEDKDIFHEIAIRELYENLFAGTSDEVRMHIVDVLKVAKTPPSRQLLSILLEELNRPATTIFPDKLAKEILLACGEQEAQGTQYIVKLVNFMKTRYSKEVKEESQKAIAKISQSVGKGGTSDEGKAKTTAPAKKKP